MLADLQGPKIRLGRFANGKEQLVNGAAFAITVDDIQGTVDRCSTTYKGLPGESGYCSSKAAVNVYMEGLQDWLKRRKTVKQPVLAVAGHEHAAK